MKKKRTGRASRKTVSEKKGAKKSAAEKGKKNKKVIKADRKQVAKRIRSVVAEVLEVNEKRITPRSNFVEDLGMDSMRALEILAAIEKTYKIEIPEESLPKMVSYDAVIDLTMELVSRKK